MTILEPLLDKHVVYGSFISALNGYMMSQRFKDGRAGKNENVKRFISVATRKWNRKVSGTSDGNSGAWRYK